MPAAAAILAGAGLGLMCGGEFQNLASVSFRFEILTFCLFVLQGLARGRLLSVIPATSAAIAVWIFVSAILCILLLLNWRVPGMALGALGLLLNLLVVLVNGGMPIFVSPPLTVSMLSRAVLSSGGFYQSGGTATIATSLADVIPLRLMGHTTLFSVGDVVLLSAVVAIVVWGMTSGGSSEISFKSMKEHAKAGHGIAH